ncbi:hypothetical protein QVD99_003357 [Batrachochytrium dendrobatidis]|nr:hypothetical protein O5D80_008640 [Batrachochytrium dendrobatidis]KAK5670170.1 hypothetical protein QVD99_003357 [Batrachochytrium dendrobatidis]
MGEGPSPALNSFATYSFSPPGGSVPPGEVRHPLTLDSRLRGIPPSPPSHLLIYESSFGLKLLHEYLARLYQGGVYPSSWVGQRRVWSSTSNSEWLLVDLPTFDWVSPSNSSLCLEYRDESVVVPVGDLQAFPLQLDPVNRWLTFGIWSQQQSPEGNLE